MGGSGGGRTGGYISAHDVEVLREEARQRLSQSRVEAEVNALLQRELAEVNDRDVDRINDRLGDIETALADRIDEVDRLLFGGSVAKHTYVDGVSDVDALVVLGDESLADRFPDEIRNEFGQALRQALPQGELRDITVGRMAVTLEYRDGMEIQLLPAVGSADELAISSEDGATWSRIRPRRFAEALTDSNRRMGGAVVPTVKLAKSILTNELGDSGPSGHHIETLAVQAFADYVGPRTQKAMLTHFMEQASNLVLRPIQDVTGQSRFVDEGLGSERSVERQALSRRLAVIARTMSGSQSVEDWTALLG